MADILFAMRIKGAKIWAENGQLFYEAPHGTLSRADIETLRERKPEIFEFFARSTAHLAGEPPLGPRAVSERAPLTPIQLYLFNRMAASGGKSLRAPTVLTRLVGPLDGEALERALIELVRRHELLRARVMVRDGVPVLETVEPIACPLQRVRLTDGSLAAREARAKLMVQQLVAERIDVSVDPLFMAWLLMLDEHDHVLLLALDHLIFDVPSIDILQRDLSALYAQATYGRQAALPPIPLQFVDYAVWHAAVRRSRIDALAGYWERRLSGARHLRVFAEEAREAARPSAARFRFRFSPSLAAALRVFSVKHRTTLMMTLLTAYVATLSRWCEETDLVVQVPTTARRYTQLQNTIGPIATVLYVRLEVRNADSFLDLLSRVIAEYDSAYAHDDSGAIFAQTPRPDYASNPGFNFNSNPALDWRAAGGPADVPLHAAHFPVSVPFGDEVAAALQEPQLFIVELRGDIAGSFGYRADRVRATTMKRFEQSLQFVARRMVEEPTGCLPRLPESRATVGGPANSLQRREGMPDAQCYR